MLIDKKQNFISVDFKTVRNSYGEYFTVGEIVSHQDKKVGEATIIRFGLDNESNEIKATTNKGFAHIDFILKQK